MRLNSNIKSLALLAAITFALPALGEDTGKICKLESQCSAGDVVLVRGSEMVSKVCDFSKEIVPVPNKDQYLCVARGGVRTTRNH